MFISSKFKAVVPDDLFTAITFKNPGVAEVVNFWAPWTETPGFPLVSVKRDGLTLKLNQTRFLRDGISHNLTERYNIPITYAIDSDNYTDTTPKFIFRMNETGEKTAALSKIPQKYYILNTMQNGFYRVNYEEGNWKNISEALQKADHDNIHVMNRAQIVDDLFNLARAGIVKYDMAIDIIRYIKKEKNYIPWLSAFSHGLTFLSQRVSGEADTEVFSWFIRDTLDEIYKHLTFVGTKTGDTRTDIYNRVNVLTWACKYGHEDCIKESKALYSTYKTGTKVHKDLRSIVYCNAIRNGTTADFDFLFDKFTTEDIAAEQLNILSGTGCTKNTASVTVSINVNPFRF